MGGIFKKNVGVKSGIEETNWKHISVILLEYFYSYPASLEALKNDSKMLPQPLLSSLFSLFFLVSSEEAEIMSLSVHFI